MTLEQMAMADVTSPEQIQDMTAEALRVLFDYVHREQLPKDVAIAIGVVSAAATRCTEAEGEAARYRDWVNRMLGEEMDKAEADPGPTSADE